MFGRYSLCYDRSSKGLFQHRRSRTMSTPLPLELRSSRIEMDGGGRQGLHHGGGGA